MAMQASYLQQGDAVREPMDWTPEFSRRARALPVYAALRSLGEMSRRAGRPPADMLKDILAAQALDGLLEPEDIADLYLFLASDLARAITGQAYNIDRGEQLS